MNAELDEDVFLAAVQELQADKKLKKPSLQKVIRGYAGLFDRRASAAPPSLSLTLLGAAASAADLGARR